MSIGAGKGWAKGKTAATDRRVANAAAAHRGLNYVRRTPPEQCRWFAREASGRSLRSLPLEWSPTMAYVVGLMATDGCLISGRTVMNFKSEDEQLVRTFLECLGRPAAPSSALTRTGKLVYFKQFGDAPLYQWLLSVGLTPRKSLTLGALPVPDEFLLDCTRGLLDGDGSLLDYWYDGTGKAAGGRYEGFRTVFNSASRKHLEWLQTALDRVVHVRGALQAELPNEYGTVLWRLSYAIRESANLLPRIYATPDVPCLRRKFLIWQDYATRHALRVSNDAIAETSALYGLSIAELDHRIVDSGSLDRYH